jgi:hypothetical protein
MHLVGLFHLYGISELIVLGIRNSFRQKCWLCYSLLRSINNTTPSDCQVMYEEQREYFLETNM